MARQGNYVTLPGGGVNWAKDISGSLNTLSKSLMDQGDAKLERERLAAAEAENQRRFNLQEDRASRTEQAQIAERNRVLSANKALKDYAANYTQEGARRAAFDRNKVLKGVFENSLEGDLKNLARNLYVDQAKSNRASDPKYTKMGVNLGLTKDMVLDTDESLKYMKFLQEQDAKGLLEGNEKAKSLVNQFKEGKTGLQSDIASYVDTYTPLYKGDEISRIARDLMAIGVDPSTAYSTSQALSAPLSLKEDETAQALKAQKTEQERYDKVADYAYKAASLAERANREGSSKSGSSSRIKTGTVEEPEVSKYLASVDPGPFDTGTLFGWYKAATDPKGEKPVNQAVAFQAMKEMIRDSHTLGISTRGPADITTSQFVEYARMREAANKSLKSGGGKKSIEQYRKLITPKTAKYIDPEQASLDAFVAGREALGFGRSRLPTTTGRQNLSPTGGTQPSTPTGGGTQPSTPTGGGKGSTSTPKQGRILTTTEEEDNQRPIPESVDDLENYVPKELSTFDKAKNSVGRFLRADMNDGAHQLEGALNAIPGVGRAAGMYRSILQGSKFVANPANIKRATRVLESSKSTVDVAKTRLKNATQALDSYTGTSPKKVNSLKNKVAKYKDELKEANTNASNAKETLKTLQNNLIKRPEKYGPNTPAGWSPPTEVRDFVKAMAKKSAKDAKTAAEVKKAKDLKEALDTLTVPSILRRPDILNSNTDRLRQLNLF